MRIIGKLNPSFSYDREFIFQLVRASNVVVAFNEKRLGDAIYEAALAAFGREAYLLHQRGIYEMKLAEDLPALHEAAVHLSQALEIEPHNPAFQHSLAELALKCSNLAMDEPEQVAWLAQAESIATKLARYSNSSYAHHTLAKSAIAAVRNALAKSRR